MFCPHCGKGNPDVAKFCASCGKMLTLVQVANTEVAPPMPAPPMPAPLQQPPTAATHPGQSLSFGKAISTCMSKYADFKGRARRSEFWWFYLFTLLMSWGSLIVEATVLASSDTESLSSGMLYGLVTLALLLPSLAAVVRRLHDTNHSGWWWLLSFTIIGIIPLIIWLASKGDPQPNRYGHPG